MIVINASSMRFSFPSKRENTGFTLSVATCGINYSTVSVFVAIYSETFVHRREGAPWPLMVNRGTFIIRYTLKQILKITRVDYYDTATQFTNKQFCIFDSFITVYRKIFIAWTDYWPDNTLQSKFRTP